VRLFRGIRSQDHQGPGGSAILAKTFAPVFYRNAIHLELPLIECDTDQIRNMGNPGSAMKGERRSIGNLRKFGKIAGAMGENVEGLSVYEAAEKSIEAVKSLLNALQIPFQLSQYGIPRDHLPKLVEGGMKQARLFIPNPRDLTEEDVKSIYENAF